MKIQVAIYKVLRNFYFKLSYFFGTFFTKCKFWVNGVKIPSDMGARGIPIINVSTNGSLEIGRYFRFNSGLYNNIIGRQQKVMLIVAHNGKLVIGENVGISCSAIVCYNKITIGNNVRIGGNCVIYDTDFHDLDADNRTSLDVHKMKSKEDITKVKTSPVIIENGAFIGAHSTILKGVTIGTNSIVGACSVIAKNIPPNELWAGNPAKFIKKL